jgi:hypothetical protein
MARFLFAIPRSFDFRDGLAIAREPFTFLLAKAGFSSETLRNAQWSSTMNFVYRRALGGKCFGGFDLLAQPATDLG